MSSSAISGLASTNQLKSSSTKSKGYGLKTEDFIKMMITQLQNQDPMEPMKNDQLLSQMSQIGQMENSTQLQDSLKGLVQQNQIGAAGNLIGKNVQGTDEFNQSVSGLVTAVRVNKDSVSLELDSGKTLTLDKVTSIAAPQNAAAAAAKAA